MVREKVLLTGASGSMGFAAFEELWRRHLPGEPSPGARIMKLGIATK